MIRKFFFILALSIFSIACKNNQTEPKVKIVEAEKVALQENDLAINYQKAEFTVEGMTCAVGCAATIQKNLNELDGVKSAVVDFETKTATVEYNEAKLGFDDLAMTVTTSGDGESYSVTGMKNTNAEAKSCDKECCKGKTDAEKTACSMDCCKLKSEEKKEMAHHENCKKGCCAKKV